MTIPLTLVTSNTEAQIMTTDSNALPDYLMTALSVYEEPAELAANQQRDVLHRQIVHSLNQLNERVLHARDLMKFAEDELPNSTDDDKTRAALVALNDMRFKDSNTLFNLAGQVAQLIKFQVIADVQRGSEKSNPTPQAVNRPSCPTQPRAEEETASEQRFVPSKFDLEFAYGMMSEEQDRCAALAHSLVVQLEPNDPENPSDSDDLTGWRLAEILHDKLSSNDVCGIVRRLMLGEATSAAANA